MKKFLMVTYDFPPIGGGGIQRNLKFLKYLDRLDYDLSVLTIKERDFYVYDYTLLKELSDDVKIYRADSLDPSRVSYKLKNFLKGKQSSDSKATDEKETERSVDENSMLIKIYRVIRNWFMLPDGAAGWIPFAAKLGKKVAAENDINIVFGTFPGPSNAFVAYKVAKSRNIPYIIDFRDAWLDDPYYRFPTALHKIYHKYHEKKILSNASGIIVYGNALKEIFEKKYPHLKGKIEVITNGFDPEDFENITPKPRTPNKKRIVYSGNIYLDRKDNFFDFLYAIDELPLEQKQQLEVIFVGDNISWANELTAKLKLEDVVSFTGYLNHREAISYLASADAALLFLQKGDKIAYSGKVFEYLGLRLPIIATVEPDGVCAKLLGDINHNQGVCAPGDIKDIKRVLNDFNDGKLTPLEAENISVFSRKDQTMKLNNLINNVLNTK